MKKHPWKKQTISPDCQNIVCPPYDAHADFEMEETGHYVLIRANKEKGLIEVAVCNSVHEIIAVFSGKTSQSLYHTIFKHEKENNLDWFRNKDHIAYLGKELKKCELALSSGNNSYFQE